MSKVNGLNLSFLKKDGEDNATFQLNSNREELRCQPTVVEVVVPQETTVEPRKSNE